MSFKHQKKNKKVENLTWGPKVAALRGKFIKDMTHLCRNWVWASSGHCNN